MKLVLTLLVRDEQDILRQFLEYHLNRGVDFIVATDNRSEDGTRDILHEYERQGTVHSIYEPDDTYAQALWVTRMARMAAERFGADWVINSDADEFWWPEREASLKDVLLEVPESTLALGVKRNNFPPRSETKAGSLFDSMTYREVRSVNSLGQPLSAKVCHRADPRVEIVQGNHAFFIDDVLIHGEETDEITIFHFPVRTLEQFTNKIVKGGRAYEHSQLPAEVGNTWRRLFKIYREEGSLQKYFEEQVPRGEALTSALARGELVEDRRLLEFLDSVARSSGPNPSGA